MSVDLDLSIPLIYFEIRFIKKGFEGDEIFLFFPQNAFSITPNAMKTFHRLSVTSEISHIYMAAALYSFQLNL